jgi:hypothetical protein
MATDGDRFHTVGLFLKRFIINMLAVPLVCLVAGCSRPIHSTKRVAVAAHEKSGCVGAPTDHESDEWELYSTSHQREMQTPLFQLAVQRFGEPVSCAWRSDGAALDRVFARDHFTLTFAGKHRLETDNDGAVKTTSKLDVDAMEPAERLRTLRTLAPAGVDWGAPVHAPKHSGLARTTYYRDDGKCSFTEAHREDGRVVRLETACGE